MAKAGIKTLLDVDNTRGPRVTKANKPSWSVREMFVGNWEVNHSFAPRDMNEFRPTINRDRFQYTKAPWRNPPTTAPPTHDPHLLSEPIP